MGNSGKVSKLAECWERFGKELTELGEKKLLDYISDPANQFTREEIDAYRMGLGSIGMFLVACYSERAMKRMQVEDSTKDSK